MSYPGGKRGSGVFQTIINNIPPHDTYIETHFGGGAIMQLKRPAKRNIAIDIDANVYNSRHCFNFHITKAIGDAVEILNQYNFIDRTFIYSDPPYVMSSRKSGPVYKYEYTDDDHVRLLNKLKSLDCDVALSGYASDLYFDMLPTWRHITFTTQTRGGLATEYLWMNYPEPARLHDYQYLGSDFTDRQRIRRKIKRLIDKLNDLPQYERQAIIKAIDHDQKK